MPDISSFINLRAGSQFPAEKVIPQQGSAEKYGILSDNDKYRVTNLFDLSSSSTNPVQRLAFAMFDAQVFAQYQQGGTSLVNIVIKPLQSISANGIRVKYVIYRGIETSSLTDGTDLQTDAYYNGSGAGELNLNVYFSQTLVGRIRDGRSDNFDLKVLGITRTPSDSDTIESVFRSVENDTNSNKVEMPVVKSGNILGIFTDSKEFGIDIVLDEPLEELTVLTLKKGVNEINVDGLTGAEKRYKQELIHSYIEAGAFYSTFKISEDHVYVHDVYSNSSLISPNPLVDVLSSFQSHGKVFVDIRNEHSFSLNYFEDNISSGGKHLKLKEDGTDFVGANELDYYVNNGWPILELTPSPSQADYLMPLTFGFLRDFNPVPVVFSDGFAIDDESKMIADYRKFKVDEEYEGELPGSQVIDDWSKAFTYNIQVTGSTVRTAYLKLYVNRRHVPSYIPNTALKRENYLDNIIGPIKGYEHYKRFNFFTPSQWGVFSRRKYLNDNGIDKMVEVGAWLDGSNIVFYLNSTDTNLEEASLNFGDAASGLSSSSVLKTDFTKKGRSKPVTTAVNDNGSSRKVLLQSPNYDFPNSAKLILMSKVEFSVLENYISVMTNVSEYQPIFLNFQDGQKINGGTVYFTKLKLDLSVFVTTTNQWQYSTISSNHPIIRTIDSQVYSSESAASGLGLDLSSVELSDAQIGIDDMLQYLALLENVYSSSDNDSFINFCTRVRVHSYGTSNSNLGQAAKYVVFQWALPDANYSEGLPNPLARRNLSTWTGLFMEKDKKEQFNIAIRRITSHANENGVQDNPSPYLIVKKPHQTDPNVVDEIDFGHLLLGFEALYYSFSATSSNYDVTNITGYNGGTIKRTAGIPVNGYCEGGASDKGQTGIGDGFRKYNVYHPYDLCGLIGDIGIASSDYFSHKHLGIHPDSNKSGYPELPNLDRYFEYEAPDADLLSDIDAIGLWYAFNTLEANPGAVPERILLTDIFTLFYKGESALRDGIDVKTPLDSNYPYYTKEYRYFIFSHFLKFIKENGASYSWLPAGSANAPSTDWAPIKEAWRLRMFFFTQFWFGKSQYYSLWAGMSLATFLNTARFFLSTSEKWEQEDDAASYTDSFGLARPTVYPNPMDGTTPLRLKITETIDEIFEDKFLISYLKPKLLNESSNNGINII